MHIHIQYMQQLQYTYVQRRALFENPALLRAGCANVMTRTDQSRNNSLRPERSVDRFH